MVLEDMQQQIIQLGSDTVYNSWNKFTKKNPFLSLLIAVCVGSLLGISIEYLINKDFVLDGFLGLVVFTLIQLLIIKKQNKK